MIKKSYFFLIPYMVLLAVFSFVPLRFSSELVPGQDKFLHFFIYIPLGFLLSPSMTPPYSRFTYKLTIRLGLGSAYGALLELLQTVVPARTASFYDAAANFSGVAVGLGLGFFKGWIATRLPKRYY